VVLRRGPDLGKRKPARTATPLHRGQIAAEFGVTHPTIHRHLQFLTPT
jgi:hypothetical protein